MDLSVIIVNYNVRAFLENALTSVRKALDGIAGEIIVVDNASDDGSIEMVQQKFPDVRLIANTTNTGFGAANNVAMCAARGRFFLLLNPDTVVQETTLRTMLEYFAAHPATGLAGCKVLNPDGTLQLACRRSFPTPWVAFTKMAGLSALFPRSPLFGRYNLTYRSPDESYEVDAISGSFMFMRRELFEQTRGFDEQFFMYGEDLDLCYRTRQLGWKIAYVHTTQIIHYKGESARRSDIDEVKLFYEAMRVFVRKHIRRGLVTDLVLRTGIAVREWIAFGARMARPLGAAVLDFLLINIALFLGEFLWFGELFRFPAYAYPVIVAVPWVVIATTMSLMGIYTTRKLSFIRTAGSVLIGYIILSALVYFFKDYGFSRMVVGISGLLCLLFLPGWRLAARALLRSPEHRKRSLFGRRTVIVGTGPEGQEVLHKLRVRIEDGYDIVGFVDVSHKRIGEKIAGVEILGSIDNIGRIVNELKVSEVIFSTEALSYADILAVIARTRDRTVNFRLVPSSLEVIIGKTHIDELTDLPLVEIEYNIHRPVNRLVKRAMDLAGGALLLCLAYPFIAAGRNGGRAAGRFGLKVLEAPRVVRGELSLVGPPAYALLDGAHDRSWNSGASTGSYWGKVGLTGLVQLNYHDRLTPEEVEKYNLYYAKNQSFWLDCQILMKSFLVLMKR